LPLWKACDLIRLSRPQKCRKVGGAFVASQIVIEGLGHAFRPARGREVVALDDVSLDIRRREFVAVLGPSGCGKSTLLYILGGFIPVEQGRILIEGKPIDGPGPDRGVVFQHFALFPWKTVRQNILYGLERTGVPRAEREVRAQGFIDLVGLAGFEDAYPSQLSGGMKQRTAIARTLAVEPDILLMDEPFGALDAQTRSLMQGELLRIWSQSPKTVIFVTHDVQEAVYLAERVVVMSARPGRVKAIVDIDIDRSQAGVFRQRGFVEKVDEIWDLVRTEAVIAQRTRVQ
jgi:NitT/TauT family transport system ATP-binding protein